MKPRSNQLRGLHSLARVPNLRCFLRCTAFALVALAASPAVPEHLPARTYTSADGLALDRVNQIVPDTQGFLWFCTDEGLSRFDGYSFTNYSVQQGLPHRHINDLLETREGAYWIATDGGVARFNPNGRTAPADGKQNQSPEDSREKAAPEPMFSAFQPGPDRQSLSVNDLFEDRDGVIWCATNAGLFRMQTNPEIHFEYVEIGTPKNSAENSHLHTIIQDSDGNLWIGSSSGLYCRNLNGQVDRYSTVDGLPDDFVETLFLDRDGSLWAGTRYGGLCVLSIDLQQKRRVSRTYTVKDGLASDEIGAILRASTGTLFVGTDRGVCEFSGTSISGKPFRSYSAANGLNEAGVTALAEDHGKNIWIATTTMGAVKLASTGFTSYGKSDGLAAGDVISLIHDANGNLCVITGNAQEQFINRFDGNRFDSREIRLRGSRPFFAWGKNQITFQDREGQWWVPSGNGLFRFPNGSGKFPFAAGNQPIKVIPDLSTKGVVDNIYEDRQGDIWIALNFHPASLYRWNRATGKLDSFTAGEGLPPAGPQLPTAFCEDNSGNVWIGFMENGGLARYRNGSFTLFTRRDGVPDGSTAEIYLDRRGRLWIAQQSGGLIRVDDPSAAKPEFTTYTTAEGLSSSIVWCVTQDLNGRMYVGTARGLDVLDPSSGHISSYTTEYGLAGSSIRYALSDRDGSLWFASQVGVSHFFPGNRVESTPPPVLITGLSVGGVSRRVSVLGETSLTGLVLGPSQNNVEIEFIGLTSAPGEILRYSYKLSGSSDGWSKPSLSRRISFASLQPGRYRFSIRAIGSDGAVSANPATIDFVVMSPVWRRWWFLAIVAFLALVITYTFYRVRLNRFLELERVRTRIATDLHDDIGSGLSRITILSEALMLRPGSIGEASKEILGQIADTSRTLIDGMSDVIWSIDPRLDNLAELALRIRQSASDVLDPKDIKWDFSVPDDPQKVSLSPELRRHLYLIFREAINNIARHSQCKNAALSISLEGNLLKTEIADDGRGHESGNGNYSPSSGRGGHGIENMRSRTRQLNGEFEMKSSADSGTRILIIFPFS